MAGSEFDALVVGAGLTGSVVARCLAERGKRVVIWDRRGHIGGNMYDYQDEFGILVHRYGPHTFHTNDKSLLDFMGRFARWTPYRLACGAVIDKVETPTPFNFRTIDQFFSDTCAKDIKARLAEAFGVRGAVTVLEALESPDQVVRNYAQWLFEKDYSLYTAKQWGVSAEEIDPSVLKRVPLRLSYEEGYFDDEYQVMPATSYTSFFRALLDHPLIQVELGVEATDRLKADGGRLLLDGAPLESPFVYTGALDELFGYREGHLPYRSLRFEWKHENIESLQSYPVVAYPQAEGFTRITEYKKLPVQDVSGTTYAVEYPQTYHADSGAEPYYPVLTEESQKQYRRYVLAATNIANLFPCGRLADFKYYNMDQALARALEVAESITTVSLCRL
ncbi:MAG: UDP-galactopyranose mutase [Coriobacteriales bacterium]|jgi:UDP-galactopyranose mutase|nr:UDP-galactopyranose mutase [Coriobacteriales bacterium]